jgi:hypothetical protein
MTSTPGKLAMVAGRLANLPLGANQHEVEGVQICAPSAEQAAATLNVSRRPQA